MPYGVLIQLQFHYSHFHIQQGVKNALNPYKLHCLILDINKLELVCYKAFIQRQPRVTIRQYFKIKVYD